MVIQLAIQLAIQQAIQHNDGNDESKMVSFKINKKRKSSSDNNRQEDRRLQSSPSPSSSVLSNLRAIYASRRHRSSSPLSPSSQLSSPQQQSGLSQQNEGLYWTNGVGSIHRETLRFPPPLPPSPSQQNSRKKRQRTIHFARDVNVKEIPHRDDYTFEMKQAMWNSMAKIRQEARRNYIEAAWECYDWEGAVEEDDFLNIAGELVHPAHNRRLKKKKKKKRKIGEILL